MTDQEDQVADLLQFLYACPVGLIEMSADGTIALVNAYAMQLLFPIALDGVVANFYTVVGPYSPELRHLLTAMKAPHGTICEGHRIFVHAGGKNGAADPLVLSCTLVKLDDDRFIATLTDVSKQMVQERRLKQAETWFGTLLNSVDDFSVISLDRNGIVTGVNASAAAQIGLNQQEMLNRTLDTLDQPESGVAAFTTDEQIKIAERDGWHLDEGWRKRPTGERYWCQRLIAARGEDDGCHPRTISGYTVVLRAVTQNGFDSSKLRQLLTTDHLTGAYNRAYFFEAAEQERLKCSLRNESVGLIAIDVDHFKQVNDTHGHATGDAVLQAVAAACMDVIRARDVFARLGGEEFVVLLPSTDLTSALGVAETLRAAIGALRLNGSDKPLTVTASFGCSVTATASTTLTELLESADSLLYAAKRNGRNRVEHVARSGLLTA